jgi:FemAB-related protein (PEP-CTERM system-associated)
MEGIESRRSAADGGAAVLDSGPLRILPVSTPGTEWDEFVRTRPESTFCHLAGWSDVMQQSLGARPHYLEARHVDGSLAGILPLVRVRSRLLGDHLVSMPFLNYGGALGDETARSTLAEGAALLGMDLGAKTLELRSRSREASRLHPSDRRIIVELELPADADELWNGLRSKVRSQVRRPMKEAMETRSGASQRDAFYAVFASNMRDLGTPVLPRRFFEAATGAFPDRIEFVVVYHEGIAVAGGCGFFHGDEFEITWASSLRAANHLAPNMLLYWELMKNAIERGARRFNFGRCAPGGGTHRFKRQWGGADVPLGWSAWSRDGSAGLPSTDRPVFRIATGAWQRMPLWLANRLGPVVSRWLP